MIDAHDLGDTPDTQVGYDPYAEPGDYTSRVTIQQNEELIRALAELNVNIDRIANFSERQRTKEAPALLDMGPLAGRLVQGGNNTLWQSTQRFRVTNIIYGGGVAGDELRLSVGVTSYHIYTSGNTVNLEIPITIDRGMDISVIDFTTPANRLWTFMIFGYSE